MTASAISEPIRPAARVAVIAAGGAIGSLGRAGLAEWFPSDGSWPWATFMANMVGTALLVWIVVRPPATVRPGGAWQALIGAGFCGALTTFSLFQIEIIDLMRSGHVGMGIGYVAASLAAGLAIAFAIPRQRLGTT